MLLSSWSQRCLKAALRWNVLFKSVFVAAVVGPVLTLAHYGNLPGGVRWVLWKELLLNFAFPFTAEAVLTVASNLWHSAEAKDLTKERMNGEMSKELPEILTEVHEQDKQAKLSKSGNLSSSQIWPFISDVQSSQHSVDQTHANSIGIFIADEMMSVDEATEDSVIEAVESASRVASQTFDLHRHRSTQTANTERLLVFSNGLYSIDNQIPMTLT